MTKPRLPNEFKPRTVILDVEIPRTVEECGGWDRTSQMGVAVAVAYDPDYDQYRVYDQTEVEPLREMLRSASAIVSWNGWRFDLPVIFGHDRDRWESSEDAAQMMKAAKSNDMLLILQDYLGKYTKGLSLGATAERTIGVGKSGEGAMAPELFKAGRIGELVTYCIHDVWLTARLHEFAATYGFLVAPDGRTVRVRA